MSDDWSLKRKWFWRLGKEGFYYHKHEIDTLREKLIDTIDNKIGEVVFKDDVINIINKLFGVDE